MNIEDFSMQPMCHAYLFSYVFIMIVFKQGCLVSMGTKERPYVMWRLLLLAPLFILSQTQVCPVPSQDGYVFAFSDRAAGALANYSCRTGLVDTNPKLTLRVVQCNGSEWSLAEGCMVEWRDCLQPPPDNRGYKYSMQKGSYGQPTVLVTGCEDGYREAVGFVKNQSLVCLPSGLWSQAVGCEWARLQCGTSYLLPQQPGYNFGNVYQDASNGNRWTAKYECATKDVSGQTWLDAAGAQPFTRAVLCASNGQWELAFGCARQPQDCVAMPETEGYTYSWTSTSPKEDVPFQCSSDYVQTPFLQTNIDVDCNRDGAYWLAPSGCTFNCDFLPSQVGYRFMLLNKTEHIATFVCEDGYYHYPPRTKRSGQTGHFGNGPHQDKSGWLVSCTNETGAWRWEEATGCVHKGCFSALNSTERPGYVFTSSWQKGQLTAQYLCKPDQMDLRSYYQANPLLFPSPPGLGPRVAVCNLTTGEWGQLQGCVPPPRACSRPPPPRPGYLFAAVRDIQLPKWALAYECDINTGYELVASALNALNGGSGALGAHVVCDVSREAWTEPSGCVRTRCLEHPLLSAFRADLSYQAYQAYDVNWTVGRTTATYKCQDGWADRTDSPVPRQLVCEPTSQKWDKPTGCEQLACVWPPDQTGYEFIWGSATRALSRCQLDYYSSWDEQVRAVECDTASGKWSMATGCVAKRPCTWPPNQSGYIFYTNVSALPSQADVADREAYLRANNLSLWATPPYSCDPQHARLPWLGEGVVRCDFTSGVWSAAQGCTPLGGEGGGGGGGGSTHAPTDNSEDKGGGSRDEDSTSPSPTPSSVDTAAVSPVASPIKKDFSPAPPLVLSQGEFSAVTIGSAGAGVAMAMFGVYVGTKRNLKKKSEARSQGGSPSQQRRYDAEERPIKMQKMQPSSREDSLGSDLDKEGFPPGGADGDKYSHRDGNGTAAGAAASGAGRERGLSTEDVSPQPRLSEDMMLMLNMDLDKGAPDFLMDDLPQPLQQPPDSAMPRLAPPTPLEDLSVDGASFGQQGGPLSFVVAQEQEDNMLSPAISSPSPTSTPTSPPAQFSNGQLGGVPHALPHALQLPNAAGICVSPDSSAPTSPNSHMMPSSPSEQSHFSSAPSSPYYHAGPPSEAEANAMASMAAVALGAQQHAYGSHPPSPIANALGATALPSSGGFDAMTAAGVSESQQLVWAKDQLQKAHEEIKRLTQLAMYYKMLAQQLQSDKEGAGGRVNKKPAGPSEANANGNGNAQGKESFPCHICCKVLATKFSHERHIKTHTKLENRLDFRCEVCGKGYTESGNLARHMQSAHGIKRPRQRAKAAAKAAQETSAASATASQQRPRSLSTAPGQGHSRQTSARMSEGQRQLDTAPMSARPAPFLPANSEPNLLSRLADGDDRDVLIHSGGTRSNNVTPTPLERGAKQEEDSHFSFPF
eukprot:g25629.t1